MHKYPYQLIAAIYAIIAFTTIAQAQLVLNVNPNTKNLWLTGSASGMPKIIFHPYYNIHWSGGGSWAAHGADSFVVSSADLYSETGPTTTADFYIASASPETGIIFEIHASSTEEITITGEGPDSQYDYSGFSVHQQAILESLTIMTLTHEADFGNISVNVLATVPVA